MDCELFNKYFSGSMTEEEKAAFLLTVSKDEKLKKEFIAFKNTIALTTYVFDTNNISEIGNSHKTVDKQLRRSWVISSLRYAAVALIAVGITLFLTLSSVLSDRQNELTSIIAPVGQRTHLVLSDGTSVWLNSKSKLQFTNSFNEDKRCVYLDGEAYFEVAKNTKKTFIVTTSRGNVQVLGTKFNVFNYSDKPFFETTLFQGSVEVYRGSEKMRLSPNERAVITDGKLLKQSIVSHELQLWHEGVLAFENQSLNDIILRLESYYDVKFVVQEQAHMQERFTAKFYMDDDLGMIMNALSNTGKFSYRESVDGKVIYIW